ncbi:MAG: hypothetical protein J5621_08280 [Paludibacteraceae bacterium]|nr:hypothetical protein [Paludibacteraceae bacterium]
MDYKKMIKAYADAGGDEKKMWSSVDVTAEAMDYLKEVAPEKHESIMRKLSETLYGKHYSEELALADVEGMHYIDKNGVERHGAHWSVEDIEAATADKSFGKNVTRWDKYVAYNAMYADLCTKFDEEQILCAAYLFWFDDKDWKTKGKIWDYMSANV